jgi:hypothetical protein
MLVTEKVVSSLMLDGIYLSVDFATMGLFKTQPPCRNLMNRRFWKSWSVNLKIFWEVCFIFRSDPLSWVISVLRRFFYPIVFTSLICRRLFPLSIFYGTGPDAISGWQFLLPYPILKLDWSLLNEGWGWTGKILSSGQHQRRIELVKSGYVG